MNAIMIDNVGGNYTGIPTDNAMIYLVVHIYSKTNDWLKLFLSGKLHMQVSSALPYAG